MLQNRNFQSFRHTPLFRQRIVNDSTRLNFTPAAIESQVFQYLHLECYLFNKQVLILPYDSQVIIIMQLQINQTKQIVLPELLKQYLLYMLSVVCSLSHKPILVYIGFHDIVEIKIIAYNKLKQNRGKAIFNASEKIN